MEGLSIGKDDCVGGRGENGVSFHHRRSRSASDKKADISRFGVPYSIDCNHDLSLDSPFSSRTCGSETPHNGRSIDSSTSSSNHRASLEKDVYLLQSRLQQEKSMRIMLEKAIGRASSALSPGHRHFASQVHGKSSDIVKNSGVRTLKDYLHQCPSKLSEEMVNCMAAVYCWFCSATSTNSDNLGNHQSSGVSKSCGDFNPQLGSQKKHTSKSMLEISSMPTDKKQVSRASYAITSYRALVEQLKRVNVSQMEVEAQIAFWINIYNSLIMHAYLAYGIPHSSLRRLALFHKAGYNIGGIVVTANAIEHSIFCFRTPRVCGWVETFLSTAFRKKSGDEKQLLSSKLSFPDSQSLVCFALCTGAYSDPVLKVYTAANVKDELEQAKREFLVSNIIIKKSKKVFLPKMLERYSREASMGSDELLKWVCKNVDKKLQDSIQRCLDSKYCKKASQVIEWLPYSSKFRYVFSEGLATKPWWV